MNISKVSNWSNENVKTASYGSHFMGGEMMLCKKLNNNGDKI
jgi:hypothetical protein